MSELDIKEAKRKFRLPESSAAEVLGEHDKHLKIITQTLNTTASYIGGELTIVGEETAVKKAVDVLTLLLDISLERPVVVADVHNSIRMAESDEISMAKEITRERIKVSGTTKSISPKTKLQKEYITAIKNKDMVFAYGPAGTGKTFLAVAMAVNMYLEKKIHRIILTRPAVEAGEKLGFLPGDLAEKINPYLRPLYDALNTMLDPELVAKLIERGVIEVAPLAFMRGRTLSGAFIILDEAQNTTVSQMKMFLTRLGFGSKAIITGDTTQVDLPVKGDSGLMHAIGRLKDLKEIGIVALTDKDVVRHPLVTKIIKAYENESN